MVLEIVTLAQTKAALIFLGDPIYLNWWLDHLNKPVSNVPKMTTASSCN